MMSDSDFKQQQAASYLGAGDTYLEGMYETYLKSPSEIPEKWRNYFNTLSEESTVKDESIEAVRHQFEALALLSKNPCHQAREFPDKNAVEKELHVAQLINAYRSLGHFAADLDPLQLSPPKVPAGLTLADHGLTEADLATRFQASYLLGLNNATLQEIIHVARTMYCAAIGVEYTHISNPAEHQWLQTKIEENHNKPQLSTSEKKQLLTRLVQADGLEKYLALKYVGQKRFSLEGGDSLIPLLDQAMRSAVDLGALSCVIGMAHRGRLNVLVNIIGKSAKAVFDEFEGTKAESERTGDVKYHLGHSSDILVDGKPLHISLAFNPSHLEIVSPVVMGGVRARQFRNHDAAHEKVVPIILHGDSAVCGQGVVMETFNMAALRGFNVGGAIHVVVNNQVGFTTHCPDDVRSSHYCTDIAKAYEIPVFHVNGDHPESVCRVMKLAMAYRYQFKKDVMIDLVCYRRLGHNEADDPSITQPLMYAKIKKHPVPAKYYAQKLIEKNIVTQDDVKKMIADYKAVLNQGSAVIAVLPSNAGERAVADWMPFINPPQKNSEPKTAVDKETLTQLGFRLTQLPEGFTPHPQAKRLLAERDKMTAGELPMNWGYAETLAYATLLMDGYPVRLCGQDSGRGTFTHRHAVLHDKTTGQAYTPLAQLCDKQAAFSVIDSVLSEEAALAFEYGYAVADPTYCVLWEAQFGDFANGAQVVIDQFISSGEQKWNRLCGLTLLLPHGYEGMGPEHSSARLERFLQLCAQFNMQVCVPSTPAQIFHLLRRQMLQSVRKPLIVMTPKSLLRHKLAGSTFDELTTGHFQCLLPEIDSLAPEKIKRVIICSGKVYYDLLAKRRADQREDTVILRIEQLYPFPHDALVQELTRYNKATRIVCCQEEPKNNGAWYSIAHCLTACLQEKQSLFYAGRLASASPAVGYAYRHHEEQKALVEQAFE
jgi:2-oxoglutarate dehydrogenase E1 component